MNGFVLVIRRALHLTFRQGFESLMVVAFFVIAVLLFPLGVGPEPNILARILPGVIWVAALLASMLSLERLFQTITRTEAWNCWRCSRWRWRSW